MSAFPIIPVLSAGLLLIVGVLLFSGSGASERRLRERVAATNDLKAREPNVSDHADTAPSSFPLLTRIATWLGYRSDLPARYAASLRVVMVASFIIGCITFNLAKYIMSPVAALAGGAVVALVIASVLFRRKSKRYTELLFRQIPDTMSLMLRAVRAGLPIAEAVRSVSRDSLSPTQEEFARVAGETALGMPIETALRRLADRTHLQEYAFFAVVIGLQGQTGGNLSETLENLADLVRRRVAMVGKGKALSAEGRLSALVVGALPFIVALLTMMFNPDYMSEFIINPRGPMLIGVFFVLLFVGLFTTHILIERSTQD